MAELVRNDPVVFHFRIGERGPKTQAKGGATVVFRPDRKQFGIALCCSKDRYNRKIGSQIAHSRASLDVWDENPNSRPRRFTPRVISNGSLEFNDVREQARILALNAASAVGNEDVQTAIVVETERRLMKPCSCGKKKKCSK